MMIMMMMVMMMMMTMMMMTMAMANMISILNLTRNIFIIYIYIHMRMYIYIYILYIYIYIRICLYIYVCKHPPMGSLLLTTWSTWKLKYLQLAMQVSMVWVDMQTQYGSIWPPNTISSNVKRGFLFKGNIGGINVNGGIQYWNFKWWLFNLWGTPLFKLHRRFQASRSASNNKRKKEGRLRISNMALGYFEVEHVEIWVYTKTNVAFLVRCLSKSSSKRWELID